MKPKRLSVSYCGENSGQWISEKEAKEFKKKKKDELK